VEECSEDDAFEDDEVDYEDSEDVHAGGSKNFRCPVPDVTREQPGTSPDGAQPLHSTSLAANQPAADVPGTSKLSEPVVGKWRNLFASNRSTTSCPKLSHYSRFTDTRGCNLVQDDLDSKYDLWKLCLVGYVAGKFPGFKALNNVIANSWNCEATLSTHESGWLIFRFTNEADKLNVLSGGLTWFLAGPSC